MPAITRITKAEKAAFESYVAEGGTRSLKQYTALSRGRALSPVTAKLNGTKVAAPKAKKSAKPTLSVPVSELFRAPDGSRVDHMGGVLVVDEAGADILFEALTKHGFEPQTVGMQTSKRRGIRMQMSVKGDIADALQTADDVGFRTWSAA